MSSIPEAEPTEAELAREAEVTANMPFVAVFAAMRAGGMTFDEIGKRVGLTAKGAAGYIAVYAFAALADVEANGFSIAPEEALRAVLDEVPCSTLSALALSGGDGETPAMAAEILADRVTH